MKLLFHCIFIISSSSLLWSLLLIKYFLLIQFNQAKDLTCRNENGESVDWYYLYKFPYNHKKSIGFEYTYMTSDSYKNGWKLSNLLINDTNSFPGRTLLPIFNNENILSVTYNDENPNGKINNIDGHTKGIIASTINYGFWLIHSVPKYPNMNLTYYTYPETGKMFGQSFLCITFNGTEMNKIGKQLIYNEPNVYHINIPDNLKNIYSNFINVSEKKWKISGPYWNQINLISSNGRNFQSFAKGRKFKKELYEDWLAPILNVDLFVETWRNGGGNLQSNCTRTKHILNVAKINMNVTDDYSFKSTQDHSKWCVSTKNKAQKSNNDYNSDDWICVGDINRQEHQLKRGGGTVCQSDSMLAKAYRDLVEEFEPCGTNL